MLSPSRMLVLIVYDVDGWAFHHEASALRRYAPSDIEVHISARDNVGWDEVGRYDLVFWLPALQLSRARAELSRRGLDVPLVASYNRGPYKDNDLWLSTLTLADFVIVNNARRWEHSGVAQRTCCIANGVDAEIFRPTVRITDRPHRCLWTGSILQSEIKRYRTVILPLAEELRQRGFECDFRLVDSFRAPATLPEMAAWYNTGSYILCASIAEGTPNPILEGMSCGCVPVSTLVGNICEFGHEGENCIIAEGTVESFVEKLERARKMREELSENAIATMKSWSYGSGGRAQFFYQVWRRIVLNGADSIRPFRYDETDGRRSSQIGEC
jgi:hypothetical protein